MDSPEVAQAVVPSTLAAPVAALGVALAVVGSAVAPVAVDSAAAAAIRVHLRLAMPEAVALLLLAEADGHTRPHLELE